MIGKGRTYSDLLPLTVEMEVRSGVRIRVLSLESQIAITEDGRREGCGHAAVAPENIGREPKARVTVIGETRRANGAAKRPCEAPSSGC
jgi:hypothetical protein